MGKPWIWPWWQALAALAGLGLMASCRNGEERARAGVLEAGYRFTIGDYHRAAAAGQGGVVEQFLGAGMQVDAVGPGGETALQVAAGRGQSHVVSRLLAAGAQVGWADGQGVAALLAAAEVGDEVSVAALRAAGADPAQRDEKGRTALTAAAAAGHAGVVDLLLPEGAGGVEEALQLACQGGHSGVIDSLLRAEPRPAGEARDWGKLLAAAGRGGHLAAVRLLANRMPEAPQAEAWWRAGAAAAQAAGKGEVAAFFASGGRGAGTETAEEEAVAAAVIGAGGAEVSGAGEPLRKTAARPGPLGGSRFPKVRCDAMAELPKVLRMKAWEPRAWPVVLVDVAVGNESAEVRLLEEPTRSVTLRVGEEIPGTGCVVEKLRRRRLYADAAETVLKNASELHFRRRDTGEVFVAVPGEPVLSKESTARLRIEGVEREWAAGPGDEFRLGSLLLRVSAIEQAGLVLENRLTRETVQVLLEVPP